MSSIPLARHLDGEDAKGRTLRQSDRCREIRLSLVILGPSHSEIGGDKPCSRRPSRNESVSDYRVYGTLADWVAAVETATFEHHEILTETEEPSS